MSTDLDIFDKAIFGQPLGHYRTVLCGPMSVEFILGKVTLPLGEERHFEEALLAGHIRYFEMRDPDTTVVRWVDSATDRGSTLAQFNKPQWQLFEYAPPDQR